MNFFWPYQPADFTSSSLINPSLHINGEIAIAGRYFMITLEPMAKNRVKMSIFQHNPFFDPYVRACSRHGVIQTIFFTMVGIMTNTCRMASHGD